MKLPLAQRPDGVFGQLFGWLMEKINTPVYRHVVNILSPESQSRILEIGYGTGSLLEILASQPFSINISGVDPSPTMQSVAHSRLKKFIHIDLKEIRQGFDNPLEWPSQTFDAVIAVHCFQFWSDPKTSLIEIKRVLKRAGRLLIALRSHPQKIDWLPNPISKSGNEAGELKSLLEMLDYSIICIDKTKDSICIYAKVGG